ASPRPGRTARPRRKRPFAVPSHPSRPGSNMSRAWRVPTGSTPTPGYLTRR
uniref:hypothetical protein n=1 Tax=Sphingomonas sp. TaxID=28214 RepID=UPI0035657D05